MNRRFRSWRLLATMVAAVAITVAVVGWRSLTPAAPPEATAPLPRPPVAVALAARPIVNDVPMQSAAAPGRVSDAGTCLGTPLRILRMADGTTVDECLGAPSSSQNGDIRQHRFDAASGWSLTIRVSAGQVRDVVAARHGDIVGSCEAAACTGIRIGLPDQAAVQSIDLDALPLTDADGTVRELSARLRSAPGLACIDESLAITYSDSRYLYFCPFGGSGIVYDEAGRATVSFRSLEGTVVRVQLDARDQPVGVDYGPYRCSGDACAGVRAVLADPLGARLIRFSGTVLLAAEDEADQGALGVTLDGSLDLPSEPDTL